MFKDHIIIKQVSQFIISYIIIFGIYIQSNGEVSPGGGFQAGIIFCAVLIIYDNIKNINFSVDALLVIASLGVFLYLFTGIISVILGSNYLNYSALITNNQHLAQNIGIFTIELGVGCTVSSTMILIYSLFKKIPQ